MIYFLLDKEKDQLLFQPVFWHLKSGILYYENNFNIIYIHNDKVLASSWKVFVKIL